MYCTCIHILQVVKIHYMYIYILQYVIYTKQYDYKPLGSPTHFLGGFKEY